jgi:hypothetical protein
MSSLTLAALLPIAQAADAAPDAADAAARVVQELFARQSGESLVTAIAALVIGVIIQVLAYWIAAKVVVGEPNATFSRALLLWVLYLVVGVALGVALGVLIAIVGPTHNLLRLASVAGGWLLLSLLLVFVVPMKVFDTSFPRALGLLVLSLIVILAGQTALDRALGHPALARWEPLRQFALASNEERKRQVGKLLGTAEPGLDAELDRLSQPAEKKKTIPQRQAALRAVLQQLEARRKALPPGDAAARAEYVRQRTRYDQLVLSLKADFAAQHPAP